jgi:PAS domain S-box-containing protein
VSRDATSADSGSAALTDPSLDVWAEILTGTDPDRALSRLLADFCGAVGASAAVLLQSESSHLLEQSWSFCEPGREGGLPALTDSARQAAGLELLSEQGVPTVPESCTWVLESGRERVGVLAFLSKLPSPSTARSWMPLFSTALAVRHELGRMRALVAQYERGFQTLDRQVRVLDFERQKLAAVLNNAEIGFLVLDGELGVTWANPAMALRLNAAASGFGILKEACHQVVCGQSQPCAACPARAAQRSGEARRTEIHATSGSERRRLFATAVPIKGSSGHVQETLLMVQDLSRLDALQQSESRYRLLFETSLDAIFMAAPPEFRIVMANPATHELLGYDAEQLRHLNLSRIHLPEDWQHMSAQYAGVVEGLPLRSEDCLILDARGQHLYCSVSALPFEMEGQKLIMCNLRDITARKRAEGELEQSFSILQGTLESTADGILVVDSAGKIISCNQKFLQMWKIPPEVVTHGDDHQALAWVLPQLAHPEAFLEKVRDLYTQVDAESHDLIEFKDGRVFERYSQPHRMGGREAGRVWSFRDVTDRKRSEAKLQYRLRFENLIATLSSHFINLATREIDLGIQEALGSLGDFAGVDRSYIFLFSDGGQRFSNTHEWCADGITAQRDRAQDLPCSTFPWFLEHIRRGEAVHIPSVADLPAEAAVERAEFEAQQIQSLIAVPIAYGKSIWGFLGFDSVRYRKHWAADVVSLLHIAGELFANALARKRAESDKASLEEQLLQSQKMEAVGTLAGGIAHDFNNLLTGILGYADLLRAGNLTPAQTQKAASVIDRAARRAAELTQQLLGFARKGKYQNIPVDLHATVAEVTSLLGRTLAKNIVIDSALRARDPFVLGDPVQIQQVILNLSVNARDAMEGGGTLTFMTDRVRLCTRPASDPDDDASDFIKLVVADTGCGIPLEVQPRIFEPFFTTKEQGKGTGMGLSMVYGIVKNHGGSICVSSDGHSGTRFEILWPAVDRPRLVEETGEETVRLRVGKTVLLVDDEEVVRNVATAMLETMGYRVLLARDGQEAVDLFRTCHAEVDVVILDMAMPRLGGRECFLELRKIRPDVRAILSTGYALDEVTQRALDEGMAGFAQKPYVMDQLAAALAKATEGARAER